MNWARLRFDLQAARPTRTRCLHCLTAYADAPPGFRHTHECSKCHHRYTRLDLIRDDLKKRRRTNPHATPRDHDKVRDCPCCYFPGTIHPIT